MILIILFLGSVLQFCCMISVEKAKELIVKNARTLDSAMTNLEDSLGCVASSGIISPIHLPLFDQSAMDGFAILFSDYANKREIKIVGEVAAGDTFGGKITTGQAVRIYTGAPVPLGADTVVQQERVSVENEILLVQDPSLSKSANIRKSGSQIKKGQVALPKGASITPGGVGYLAALGIRSITIVSQPRIAIVVTGNELKKPGKPLIKGEVYESNSYMLQAALRSIGLNNCRIISIRDNLSKTLDVLRKSLKNADLILITGGISMGKYDFVGSALTELGIHNIFYKINQKPGKPLFFGESADKLIFGLPGNPAAVLSCFYEYVYPAINIMKGKRDVFLKKIHLPIAKDYNKKQGLSFFLKGKIADNSVIPLEGQESHILKSFSQADCLIYLPDTRTDVKSGEMVEVHLLPGLY